MALVLALVAVGIAAPGDAAGQAADQTIHQASGQVTYRHVDTWRDVPWQLTAGRYGHVGDISTAPDGTTYVLDARHQAVHVAGADGQARSVFRLPAPPEAFGAGTGHRVRRIDVGFDGSLYVLSTAPSDPLESSTASWVDILGPDGRQLGGFEVSRGHNDIAATATGAIYLSRSEPLVVPTPEPRQPAEILPGGVDVYDRRGAMVDVLEHPSVFYAIGVDVADDGTVYVVNRVPSPWDYDRPGPQPTPPPALAIEPRHLSEPMSRPPSVPDQDQDDDQDDAPAVEGIVVFESDHAYRETVKFTTPEDVAVGRAGVFVSRNVEIFALGASEPLYRGPPGQIVVGFYDGFVLYLDAPADGRLLGGMAHCFFQGVVRIDTPWADWITPRYVGALDAPHLEGPVRPRRLAAGDELALLGGRFGTLGVRPHQTYQVLDYAPEPQSVQRWTTEGSLRAQLGLCAGSMSAWLPDKSETVAVRDVAAHAASVYTIDPRLLRRRPDDLLPEWSYWAGAVLEADETSYLWSVSASGERVAVLDAGAGRVHVLRADGSLEASWAHGVGGPSALPTDIALSADALFLADGGGSRVTRYSLAGAIETEWATDVSPYRVEVDDQGDVYVLGRGGWAQRFGPSGELKASWRMPDLEPEPVDIAILGDGRVFVAYERRYTDHETGLPTSEIADAGIWVFEAVAVPDEAPVGDGRCLAAVDKSAEPGLVRLGDEVEVRLQVDGWCPGAYDPVQVVLLIDTSRSMNWHEALDRAKEAALTLVENLDPAAAEVALVTFDDEAELRVPLTRDHAVVAASVARLEAYGDSHLAEGITVAHAELTGPRASADAAKLVVIVSDGEYTDKAAEAAGPARDDGIEFHALALPHGGLSTYFYALKVITDSDDRVLVDPDSAAVRRLARDLIRYRPTLGAFETLAIDDVVPSNMRYVVGSAVPPASYDGTTLSWTLGPVAAAEQVELGYRLQPLETGEWPTNVTATADYLDALGSSGSRAFPVPRVRVWDEASLTEHIYLPFGAARSCFRSNVDLDTVLVIDTSRSMDETVGGGRTKLDAAREAALHFAELLRSPGDRAAVVAFNEEARIESGLTADRHATERALGRLSTAPGTRIDRGLAAARGVLEADGSAAAQPVVILLTDGLQQGDAASVMAEARALNETGVLVFTIGLGDDVDAELLTDVATTPADYLASPTTDDLDQAFRRVLAALACRVPPRP